MNQPMKTKGPVSKKEHTAFVNLWLEYFIFCGPSLAPTKNYLPLAYHLAHGNHTSLGKLFLGETYRYLHLMTTSLLNQRKLRTGGPWWFIQLWAQLYFQHQIPNFQSLTKNSFPDENGKLQRYPCAYGFIRDAKIPNKLSGTIAGERLLYLSSYLVVLVSFSFFFLLP